MHWRTYLSIATAAVIAASVMTAGAQAARQDEVKGKIRNGTLTVTGTSANDTISLALRAGDPTNLVVDDGSGVPGFFNRSQFDSIEVNAGAGDDVVSIDESGGVFTDTEATTLNGQAGDDTLRGGSFSETFQGGSGEDVIDGNRGADTASMGSGGDTFQWDPGDGSDVVEGQSGRDTMLFNGSNVGEKIDLSANGGRLRLFRDVGNITMDTDGVESVDINALGGPDTVTVNDLKKTDVKSVNANLAATGGGGDGAADSVVVTGTLAADKIQIATDSGGTVTSGLAADVAVTNPEPTDALVVNGLAGNDRVTAEPATLPLLVQFNGGDGDDTTVAQGSDGNDALQIAAATPAVAISGGGAGLVQAVAENLLVNGLGGDDAIGAGNGLSTLVALTIDGGSGNDTINGGDGDDALLGGDGNDLIDGNRGADTASMGSGDDTFQWDPGDGSDVVEGRSGSDRMLFNGSNVGEKIDLSANGGRLRLVRDVGAITMDTNGVETVDVNALGGSDTLTVNDLKKTDVNSVNGNLGAIGGGGDGAADSVIVNGTNGTDAIVASGSAGSATVTGLAATVAITGAEVPNDTLAIKALGSNDTVDASGLAADAIGLTVDGGSGNDTINGGGGADALLGGDGNDQLDGNRGNDTASMGAGDDTFVWDPGDGSDVVEGQAGSDRMLFNGANVSEKIDLSANGARLRLFRDVGNITMDTDGVETVDVNALGGPDTLTVNDLTGTAVTKVNANLAATGGGGDGQSDRVIVNGTNGNDAIVASGSAGSATVTGLAATEAIAGAEVPNDVLAINPLGGDDTVDASHLAADAIALTVNGGDGADALIGSAGNDQLDGDRGNDVALMGAGDDTFVWDPGDGSDTVEGQAGSDRMLFNGANINEKIDLSANGGRLRLFRDVAAITMDTDGVETVDINALGGSDTLTVNDLTGTDVTKVNTNLAAAGGGGDGAADSVIVNGTNGNDAIVASGSAGSATVAGLPATVAITGAEVPNDTLVIHALGGDDVVDGSRLIVDAIGLNADGGDGADVLIGGAGNDVLLGGAGDDVLIGGPGQDSLDGGPGNNILIQD